MQITNSPSAPFVILHIDHFGPIMVSTDGSKHILVIFDAFSRLYAVKSTGTKEVIKHLSELFNIFGNPCLLVSYRDTAFTSQDFAEFLKSKHIKYRQVATLWANGLVERVNRFLKSSLKKVVNDQAKWHSCLNTVQYAINNTYHSSIKSSASKLFIGFDQRNHSDAELVKYLNKIADVSFNFIEERDNNRLLASQRLLLKLKVTIRNITMIIIKNRLNTILVIMY